MTTTAIFRFLIPVLFAGGLAGCKGKLDAAKLEKEIKTTVEDQTDAKVASVTCPKEQPLKEGDKFKCDVAYKGGGDGKVAVKQTSDDGDVKFELEGSIIVPKTLEKKIADGLAEKGFADIDVDCGKKVRTAEEDDTFTCDATDPQGGKRKIAVTVKDDEGNIRWKVE
jgi:hypothetical protein